MIKWTLKIMQQLGWGVGKALTEVVEAPLGVAWLLKESCPMFRMHGAQVIVQWTRQLEWFLAVWAWRAVFHGVHGWVFPDRQEMPYLCHPPPENIPPTPENKSVTLGKIFTSEIEWLSMPDNKPIWTITSVTPLDTFPKVKGAFKIVV